MRSPLQAIRLSSRPSPSRAAVLRSSIEACEPRRLFASVAGRVFNDANANGAYDAGDSSRKGVVVYADLNRNGVLDSKDISTKTKGNGKYDLKKLPDGKTFDVRISGISDAQVHGSVGSANPVTTSKKGKSNLKGRDFAITVAQPTPTSTSISGTIFYDDNANGHLDGGEATTDPYHFGVSRVYADLNENGHFDDGEPSAMLPYGGSPTYTLAGVPAGRVVEVRFEADAGSAIDAGGLYQTTPAGFGYGAPLRVNTSGGPVADADLGFVPLGTVRVEAVIDSNKNGVADAGEFVTPGFAWLDVDNDRVRDADEPEVPRTFDGDGVAPHGASVLSVPYGPLTVAFSSNFEAPVGTVADAATTFTASPEAPNVLARIALPPTGPGVTGIIYDDLNGSGTRDAGEPPLYQTIVFADYNNNGIRDADDDFTLLNSTYTSSPTYYLSVDAGRSFTLRIQEYDGPTIRTTQTYAIGALTGTQQVLGKDFANPPA